MSVSYPSGEWDSAIGEATAPTGSGSGAGEGSMETSRSPVDGEGGGGVKTALLGTGVELRDLEASLPRLGTGVWYLLLATDEELGAGVASESRETRGGEDEARGAAVSCRPR
ncbi:hypothetical protein CVT26_013430 [Gymnopilus dilepis]|uniref:Uncharacterized protein n=1 Tax=Gymnopilus dilepis TaxID=231916 RepID=A0A409YWU0_9AGAR|nr:hypothetical protein CVT26_013430 [Gymnopilus dilepis]